MAKSRQEIVSADLSIASGLYEWFKRFRTDSGYSDSEIIRGALKYYRASTGPEVVLMRKRLRVLEQTVGTPESWWRSHVDDQLAKIGKHLEADLRVSLDQSAALR